MNKSVENIIKEAAELGIEFLTSAGKLTNRGHWMTTCRKCSASAQHGYQMDIQPQVMATKMRNKGWQISKREQPLCPLCVNEIRNEARAMNNKQQHQSTIGPNAKITRKIFNFLDDHFNEATRTYRLGWNDSKIAKEIDTSPELVIRIREEAYGALAEDPAIQGFRDELELLKMEVSDMVTRQSQEVATLMEKICEVEKRITLPLKIGVAG